MVSSYREIHQLLQATEFHRNEAPRWMQDPASTIVPQHNSCGPSLRVLKSVAPLLLLSQSDTAATTCSCRTAQVDSPSYSIWSHPRAPKTSAYLNPCQRTHQPRSSSSRLRSSSLGRRVSRCTVAWTVSPDRLAALRTASTCVLT